MNFWTPTDHPWGHGFEPVDMPWYLLYDYVEVFTFNEETNDFEFHWRDDFNRFNSDRWHKADGGFEANSSVFSPDNVYTYHGNLVLKMEPEKMSTKPSARLGEHKSRSREDGLPGEQHEEPKEKSKPVDT